SLPSFLGKGFRSIAAAKAGRDHVTICNCALFASLHWLRPHILGPLEDPPVVRPLDRLLPMTTARSPRPRVVGLLFAALTLAVASCSADVALHPVRGKVSVNGAPAPGAVLVFHPEGGDMKSIPATATTGADGTFTLVTGDKPGARTGKYLVTVVWPDPTKNPTEQQAMMGMSPDAPDLLGGRYATLERSTLRAEIKAGENTLEPFDLK